MLYSGGGRYSLCFGDFVFAFTEELRLSVGRRDGPSPQENYFQLGLVCGQSLVKEAVSVTLGLGQVRVTCPLGSVTCPVLHLIAFTCARNTAVFYGDLFYAKVIY